MKKQIKATLIIPISCIALIGVAQAQQTVSVIANSGSGVYVDASSSALASGSLLRFGLLDTTAYGSLADQNDFAQVDSVFTELGTASANVSGEYFVLGASIPATTPGEQLYTWVFNNSLASSATNWGIFTGTSWVAPASPGGVALSNANADTVIRGTDLGSGNFALAAIPEPSALSLLFLGVGSLLLRRRR